MFQQSYAFNLRVKGSLSRSGISEEEEPPSTPPPAAAGNLVDPVLFLCLAFAAICTFADWLLSKEEKGRIRQRVGDYWTILDDTELHQLFSTAWGKAQSLLQNYFLQNPWSPASLLIRCTVQACLLYASWRICLALALVAAGFEPGSVFAPSMSIIVTPNWPMGLLLLLWLLTSSWVTWQGFSRSVELMDFSAKGSLKFLSTMLATALLVSALSLIFLDEIVGLPRIFDYIHDGRTPVTAAIQVSMDEHEFEPVISALLSQLTASTATMVNAIVLIFAILVFIASTLGPSIVLAAGIMGTVVFHCLLKRFAFVLKPLASRVLTRLYESDKGTLTQVGVFTAAAVKLIEEGIKRLV